MKYCKCKDRIILNKGNSYNIAYEQYCTIHGYYTSCYICNGSNNLDTEYATFTTELCKGCSTGGTDDRPNSIKF